MKSKRLIAWVGHGKISLFMKWIIAAALMAAAAGCKRSAERDDFISSRLIAEKRAQAYNLASGKPLPVEVGQFFDAAGSDSPSVTNLFATLSGMRQTNAVLGGAAWTPINAMYWIREQDHAWASAWRARFAQDIIKEIPEGSIYFGGTDAGQFLVMAASESDQDGRPFFILTQNALADATYLDYLRRTYGGKIHMPSGPDLEKALTDYMTNAQERMLQGDLKPGEDIKVVDGRLQVSGQTAVMEINARLVKTILDANPGREVYLEESLPMDRLKGYLEPHELVLKLNHSALAGLGPEVVRKDHEFWTGYLKELIGDWLNDGTSIKEICGFVEKVYLKKDLTNFTGNAEFAGDPAAQKSFGKLRCAGAALYAWRAENAATDEERQRMLHEAGFAFRQALALCPSSPDTVYPLASLLLTHEHQPDAVLVAQTYLEFDPNNSQMLNLVKLLGGAKQK